MLLVLLYVCFYNSNVIIFTIFVNNKNKKECYFNNDNVIVLL